MPRGRRPYPSRPQGSAQVHIQQLVAQAVDAHQRGQLRLAQARYKSILRMRPKHPEVLHLLGIDHEKLTFRHNGIDRRLTDVHGKVIPEIMA